MVETLGPGTFAGKCLSSGALEAMLATAAPLDEGDSLIYICVVTLVREALTGPLRLMKKLGSYV